MDCGDRVTYEKTRDTQHVEPERRDATGTVRGSDIIDGEKCVLVEWDWSPGATFWVPAYMLRLA